MRAVRRVVVRRLAARPRGSDHACNTDNASQNTAHETALGRVLRRTRHDDDWMRGSEPPLTPGVSPASTTESHSKGTKRKATVRGVPIGDLSIDSLPLSGGDVDVAAVSCWSAGSCVAGGGYSPSGHTYTNAFLAAESDGHWGKAFLVPGLSSLDQGDAEISWVSRPSRGTCSAGGYYDDDPNAILVSIHNNVFVVNEVHGEWYRAIAAPALSDLGKGDDASLDAGTCVRGGNCLIVGTYADSNITYQPYSDMEINGIWQEAHTMAHVSEDDPNGSPSFASLKCSTLTSCVARGTYSNSGSDFTAIL
jgi:hypothetical protein